MVGAKQVTAVCLQVLFPAEARLASEVLKDGRGEIDAGLVPFFVQEMIHFFLMQDFPEQRKKESRHFPVQGRGLFLDDFLQVDSPFCDRESEHGVLLFPFPFRGIKT